MSRNALAEIQVIPIGVGVSVRNEVKRAHDIIRNSGLTVRLHAYRTNVEGDRDTILATIKRERPHLGSPTRLPNTTTGIRSFNGGSPSPVLWSTARTRSLN